MPETEPQVYFVDGFVARRNLVGIAAYVHDQPDVEQTFFYMYSYDDDDWGYEQIEHEIRSVSYTRQAGKWCWWLLSKRGVVVRMTADGMEEEDIDEEDTGLQTYGYLNKLRDIGGRFYACGMSRQVYKRTAQGWVHIDDTILADKKATDFSFESIDGTSSSDIYAVGWKGEIYHYNGKKWRKLPCPTNLDLHQVRCVEPNLVYICGEKGIFMRGAGDLWELFETEDFEEDLWGLEVFQGVPYVAYADGLMQFDGSVLVPLKTRLKPEVEDGYRLHAADGVLWSFGQQELAWFDGSKWHRVVCPDNA